MRPAFRRFSPLYEEKRRNRRDLAPRPTPSPPYPAAVGRTCHAAQGLTITNVNVMLPRNLCLPGEWERSATSSWAFRASRRRSSRVSCIALSRPGSPCGCSSSSPSRRRSAGAGIRSSTRSRRSPSTCRTAARSPRRCTAGGPRHLRPFVPALRRTLAAPPRGLARARADRARRRRSATAAPALRPAQDLHQGAAAGGRARRPAARRARGPPPARALRPRHDDGHVAGGADRRAPVLVHRPRARHLRAAAEPARLAAPQAARRALRGHLHRGERPPPARRSPRERGSTSSTTA